MTSSRGLVFALAVVIVLAASTTGYLILVPGGSKCPGGNPCASVSATPAGSFTQGQSGVGSSTAELSSAMAVAPISSNSSVSSGAGSSSSASQTFEASNSVPVGSNQTPLPLGSFSYTPGSPVKVLSVSASVSQSQGGARLVTFSVEFQNTGTGEIYVLGGAGGSLSVASVSGSAVTYNYEKFRCEIPVTTEALGAGQTYSSHAPGCGDGYTLVLSQPGSVEVQLSLTWSEGPASSPQRASVEIAAALSLG